MRYVIVDEPVPLFDKATDDEPSITLPVGCGFEMGPISMAAGKTRVRVTLPNGKAGYIPGTAKTRPIRKAVLQQERAAIHTEPSTASAAKSIYSGARLYIGEPVTVDNSTWIKVQDSDGSIGYIEPQTRVVFEGAGSGKMWLGAFFILGALVLMVATGYVMYPAFLFGGVWFVMGLVDNMKVR